MGLLHPVPWVFFSRSLGPKALVFIRFKRHTTPIQEEFTMQITQDNMLIMSMEFIAVSTQGTQRPFAY